jgi:predicted nuclease of predicted toxin-antitoxin system
MPVTPQVVAYLEAAGHGAVHASSVGLALASDTQILEVALGEGRVVVTADLDYPRLVATSKAAGPGIILFRGGAYSDADILRLLSRVLGRADQLDLEHSITVVERGRIRRRALPLR